MNGMLPCGAADLIAFMETLAAAAARETLPRFRLPLVIDNKDAGAFDPVTEADREAERVIRALIAERFPGHDIVGEEHGAEKSGAEFCWHIDPVDGTRAFICGLPSWGTLIGLAHRGRAVAGLMHQPFTGEVFAAADGAAFFDRGGTRQPLATRPTRHLAEAVMMTTSPHIFAAGDMARYRKLEAACRMTRYGFDCYAYAMVAAGNIDLVAESGLKSYDICALIPIVEQAGGVVSDWAGGNALDGGGRILAAANRDVHAAALAMLS
jgi:histidinol phosphatase-like enzyme (inositol monophosphatase family)